MKEVQARLSPGISAKEILALLSHGISASRVGNVSGTDDDAFVEVRHASTWFGRNRSFEISIDDHPVGLVGKEAPWRYRLAPGRHTLVAKMDSARTQDVTFDVQANQDVVFLCALDGIYACLWRTQKIALGMLAALVVIMHSVASAFSLPKWVDLAVFLLFVVPCLTTLGLCGLVSFSRTMPWSPPGSVFRLFRHHIESAPSESE
jgi:hypothetical protein